MNPPSSTRSSRLVPFLPLLFLTACGGEAPVEQPPEVYTVRGTVRQLPSGPVGEMQVRHEAIPSFKDADGEVVGMESMTMPFPLADAALAEGLAAGDRIEMQFEVRWHGGSPLQITALEKLPSETRLAFEKSEEEVEGQDEGSPEGSPDP